MGRVRWFVRRITSRGRRRRFHAMLDALVDIEVRDGIDGANAVETILATAAAGVGATGRLTAFQYGTPPGGGGQDLTFQMGASLILAEEGVSLAVCHSDRTIFADLGRIAAFLADHRPSASFGETHGVLGRDRSASAILFWDGVLYWVEDGRDDEQRLTWSQAVPRLRSWEALVVGLYATGHTVAEVQSPPWLRREGKLTTRVFKPK